MSGPTGEQFHSKILGTEPLERGGVCNLFSFRFLCDLNNADIKV